MAGEGAVAVSVRIRPLCNREEELGETTHVYWKADNNAIYQIDGSKSFNFDRVFHSDETTKNVYDEIAVPIIESAIQGYNGTIFAYGQTASGKTHTMMGSEDCLGVIPRAIHDIFNKIKKFPEREFLLRVSYMEIYNETITDLLCNTEKMKPLIIREDINRNVYVADLTEEVVYTSEMALQWISKGEQSRHYGITKMNQRSSRSHTIFRMILESREKGDSANCDGSIKVSHLNLVDLAGSERAAQTGAEGMRFKEGCNINRSLFILGQVIKKLSDGQNGGFINYRDSKLTRILQNSLGGNAKTRIICTITSASFDETLTTLQFASTAKYMKNTPYVNEVSSDEALLKRYRKEIVDLKKQLEEVSIKTRAQEMEKDQLAQLLDEKDLLQKVQDEKIQNLKRMLVTSSSLASQQELKAKKKRRVTWCLGKINKMKDSTDVDEFKIPSNVTRRSRNTSVAIFGESDESLSVEPDVFSNTFEPLTEGEWSSATKLLSQENLESELSSLHAKYDNLVLDNEQLRRENEELELKLKEKTDLDEFEALERQAEKDREMQLIHEIDNLKGLIQNAEAHNQDLENELSSKVELLTEKEEHIKYLQKHINSQKSEDTRMSLSFSSEITEDLKQTKQTLLDTNTVLLYANKELAFLRSENLELKEKIKELSNSCKQMEKDIQLYQNQLEAEKKIQVDINKELQSAFNEIAKLTSLLDGKVPKDLLCNLELEGRIVDLQRELNKEAKENESLKKEVNLLSELKSLPSEVEMLKKEIHKKSEELTIITSEKEKLFSAIAHKDKTIQSFLEEMGKAKDDLAASQLNYKSIDEEFQDFKTLHIEFKEKYKIVLEENERMKQEIENLSKESEIPDLSLDSLKTELSQKTQELQQKTTESQERVKEVEQLKEQLENRDSRLRTVEKEKTLITEKLHQTLEEVHALKQEKDGLKQLQESLQIERDQLKSDIQDTVNMNIDTQEQLFNALETLKQHEKTINTLNRKISEEASKNLQTADAKGELQQAVGGTDEQKWETKSTQTLIMDVKDNEVTEDQKKISTLMQENNELQQSLERITAVKEQLTTDLNDSIEMDFEYQELVRSLEDKLDKQQAVTAQEKNHATKKDEELSWTRERLAEAEANLKEKIQEARDDERSLNTGEKGGETPERRRKQGLKALYKARHSAPPRVDVEMPKLPRSPGEMTSKKKDDLQQLPQVLQSKQDQLPEHIRETTAKQVEAEEELKVARCSLKDQEETINKLKVNLSEKEYEISVFKVQLESASDELQRKTQELYEKQEELKRMQMHELDEIMNELEQKKELLIVRDSVLQNVESDRIKLNERLEKSQEEIRSLTKEKDELKGMLEALQMERDQQKESMEEIVAELRELQEKERNRPNSEAVTDAPENTEFLKQQLEAEKSALESMKMQNVSLTERLSENLEAMRSVRKERDDLRSTEECLKAERDQLKENLQQAITNDLKKEEELRVAHLHLKEHQETIDKLRVVVCEKTVEMSAMQGDLEQANASMKAQDLKKEEELRIAHLHLKECQETIDKLRRVVSEKTDEMSDMQRELEQANASIKAQFQELEEKEQQLNEAKEDLMETMCQVEHFKKQLEAQNSVLECSEAEKLRLTQELQKNLEEMKMINEENFILKDVEETLTAENEQLKESLRETEANDLKRQEELRTARVDLKEHQENIDKLREIVSQKTNEISNMKMDLENSNASLQEKIQKLKANKLQLLKLKGEISETQKQLKEQSITLSNIEMENLNLSQKLHENLEEMKSLIAERDNLRKAEEKLKVERDQLKENLQEMTARDLETQEELNTAHLHLKEQQENIDELREKLAEKTTQTSDIQKDLDKSDKELRKKIQELEDVSKHYTKVNEIEQLKKQWEAQHFSVQSVAMNHFHLIKKDHQTHREVKPKRKLLYDGEHLPESLRGKCLRIKGLLERYSEMDNEYECLDRLYLDLEKEIEIQKELSIRVKENLLVPSPQAKQIEKLLTANQKCSMEFHRVVKKFKYVLSNITKIKEEEHDSINRLQLALVDEVEKQNELEIKIQCLELDCEEPSRELKNLNLNQNIDLHIEEILKDFSENDFPSIKTEFQQVLKNRKEMSQFLEEWLSSPFDTEKLKQVIQKANSNMCRVNNFYNDKINATVNESTEFEERIAMISKNWERDLKDMRDKTKQLFKDYQSLAVSQSSAHICPTTQSCKKTCIASGDKQRTARKIQELETSLHEAKESAIHKEDLIVKMQKKLEMTNEIIAKLQTKINDSNKCLEKSKETIEILQDKVALGAQPYKEEIEDLKMKLVKVDLEKMKNDKEHEKEIHSTKSIIENQKEMIRILRENLRRNLQDQDTSMVSEHNDLQPSNRPLTCGGGSGIIQSTKALILKSEYVRLEKEMSKLKKQNEQLMKQQSELLSENHHLSNEAKTWKEKIVKKEATCENSPKTPKVTGTGTRKKENTPRHRKQNLKDPVPKESPKSCFFDSRSKSLPVPHPVRYFDNSSLGLFPEEQTAEANSVDAKSGQLATSSEKDMVDCKMQ